ncbi:cation transporter [Marinifilum caeruleilacunae]|uniref:Copper chaperone n=1 Tax=Marinifilum caeruleilacunae TaxID=2499076 RepID=A0ABX1WWG1_9BACT|nr:cation transporter [Marinifilum caeruleilacunae]NOU60447.1 copper chaperone [Marinifilum caeruleilacunae]
MKKILILILAVGLFAACQSSTKKSGESEKATSSQVVDYQEMEFNVTGMTCTGCENTVVNGLKQIKGVKEVKASHKNNRVTIMVEKDKVNREEIAQKIETVGYTVNE